MTWAQKRAINDIDTKEGKNWWTFYKYFKASLYIRYPFRFS